MNRFLSAAPAIVTTVFIAGYTGCKMPP